MLAEKWATLRSARRMRSGTRPSPAKNMPLRTDVRVPAADASAARSATSAGRSNGSPPVSIRTSGRSAGVKPATKRRSAPPGVSSPRGPDDVEQWAQLSGQRLVRVARSPAAGTGRSSMISASRISSPPSVPGTCGPTVRDTGSVTVRSRFGGGTRRGAHNGDPESTTPRRIAPL